MRQLHYPSLAGVIAIHAEILRRLGESPRPLRDEALLESAVMRPQMAARYEDADIVRQDPLLGTSISQAQAFIDGNKRTDFATLDAFLWLNGWEYVAEPLELARQLEQIADPSRGAVAATDAFEVWLRDNVRERPGTG